MTRYIFLCIAVMLSGCTTSNDITVRSIPAARIKKCLPKEWRIESIRPVNTVSGWTKMNGSNGVCITISRTPYDMTLRRTKSGELAVSIPRLYMYVFPHDFEGKHVNTFAVFRKGKITKPESVSYANRAMLVMENFTTVGNWYIFHNSPSFKDWETPVSDIINKMK
jgi:hypothetical protein